MRLDGAAVDGTTEMAENETLNLWDTYCRRWLPLLRQFEQDGPADKIAHVGVRCMYGAFKRITGLVPLADILDAAGRRDHVRMEELLRTCRDARDYADYFKQCAHVHSDPASLVAAVARAGLRKVFDQIGMELVGSARFPDLARFRFECGEVLTCMEPQIKRLAGQVANHPHEKPRRPKSSPAQKEQQDRDLLTLSLRQPRSGTHG